MITPITPLSLPPGGPSLLRPEHHLLPSTSLPPLTWPETGVQAICWEVIPENTGEGVGLRGTHRQLVEHASGGGAVIQPGYLLSLAEGCGAAGCPSAALSLALDSAARTKPSGAGGEHPFCRGECYRGVGACSVNRTENPRGAPLVYPWPH